MNPEPLCPSCYIEDIPLQRYALGYRTCLTCGEKQAKTERRQKASMCIPINKSTPTYISDPSLLRQLNPKGGLT
jgi:hypothetical protein